MRFVAGLFAAVAAAIIGVWAWFGISVQMPASPFPPGGRVHCISYAPFRGDQDPFGPDVPIDPDRFPRTWRLKEITDCVRTIPSSRPRRIAEIARQHGMKVLQGPKVELPGSTAGNRRAP
jgi:glucan 1,3-beta-glucosidase